MRLLFVKESLAWPREFGHDVHAYARMRALIRLGHEVALVTRQHPQPKAIDGLDLALCTSFGERSAKQPTLAEFGLTRWQERFLSYWGIDPDPNRGET